MVNHRYATQLANLAEWLNAQTTYLPYNPGHTVVFAVDNTTYPDPPAPAWYEPKTGNAYIHIEASDLDLEALSVSYDNKDRKTAHGLLVHEVAHSRWSRWLLSPETRKAMTPAQHAVAVMFEEMRVESRALNTAPLLRASLRASLGLIVKNMTGDDLPTNRYDIARAWALVYGRAITTVVDEDEVRWMDTASRSVLTDDDVDYLFDILQEAIEVKEENASRMVELAQEWLNVVGEPEHADEGCGCAAGEPGEKGDEKSEKSDGGSAEASDEKSDEDEGSDTSADDDLSSSAGIANSMANDDDPELKEYSRTVDADEAEMIKAMLDRTLEGVEENWDAVVTDMANAEEMARRVFAGRPSKAIKEFPPTAYHQRHVAETAKVLENFSIPAITKVSVASQTPPGRLRTREAVRGAAERSQGRLVTARPWEATKRRHARTRPIVVGIATDTSSSMRWAENAVADFAYTWTNAGVRVGARTAAVTFGDHAVAIAAPGEILSKVRRKAADGGKEQADRALAALDGGLKLSHQNGAAKLLVVVSDGHLVISNETVRVINRLKDFRAGGTKVIWVTPASNAFMKRMQKLGLADIVEVTKISYYADDGGTTFDAIQKAVLDKLRVLAHSSN